VSARAAPASRKPFIDRLPGPQRDALIGIGRRARGLFGRAFQRVFDENLPIFEYLVDQGATAAILAQLLAEVGIARDDGTALPEGTVTSALSRARERAARAPVTAPHVPAESGRDMPANAVGCSAMEAPAGRGIPTRDPPQTQRRSPFDPQSAGPLGDHRFRPRPKEPSAGLTLPADTRRAAALLGDLRSEKDDEGTY
jgi:hypothetical protein